MAGLGRHQHGPAAAPVDDQMVDDLTKVDRSIDTPRGPARVAGEYPCAFARADEQSNCGCHLRTFPWLGRGQYK